MLVFYFISLLAGGYIILRAFLFRYFLSGLFTISTVEDALTDELDLDHDELNAIHKKVIHRYLLAQKIC